MAVEKQIAILYAATTGMLDEIPIPKVKQFEGAFVEHLELKCSALLRTIIDKKELTDDIKSNLDAEIKKFVEIFLNSNK